MAIDHVASVAAMARNLRDAIDPKQIDTKVNSAALRLLIDTYLELAVPIPKVADSAARTVMGMMTAVDQAEKARG